MAITNTGVPQTGMNGTGMMQTMPMAPPGGWPPVYGQPVQGPQVNLSQLAGPGAASNPTSAVYNGANPPAPTGGSNFINNPGTPVNNGVTGSSTDPALGGVLGGLFGSAGTQIGSGLTGAAGSTNAANALNAGYGNMINQQSNLFGGIQNLYNPYTSTGSAATTGLKNLFGGGANGGTPDYSAFQNTPGLGFLQSQGSQAINRNAAATGGLYNPSTMTALSNYNIGTANSYAYQPYVNMLMQAAGLGSNATQGVSNAALTTGQNIGQGYVGQGAANASGILGASGAQQSTLGGLSNLLGGILGGGGNNGVLGNAISKYLNGGASAAGAGGDLSSLLGYNPSVPSLDQALSGGAPFTSPGSSLTGLGDSNYFGSLGSGAAPGMGAGTYLPGTSDMAPGYFGGTDMTGGLGSYSGGTGADIFGTGTADTVATGGGPAGGAGMLMPSTLSGTGAGLGLSAADTASMYGGLDASTNALLTSDMAGINAGTDASLAAGGGADAAGAGAGLGGAAMGAGAIGLLAALGMSGLLSGGTGPDNAGWVGPAPTGYGTSTYTPYTSNNRNPGGYIKPV